MTNSPAYSLTYTLILQSNEDGLIWTWSVNLLKIVNIYSQNVWLKNTANNIKGLRIEYTKYFHCSSFSRVTRIFPRLSKHWAGYIRIRRVVKFLKSHAVKLGYLIVVSIAKVTDIVLYSGCYVCCWHFVYDESFRSLVCANRYKLTTNTQTIKVNVFLCF